MLVKLGKENRESEKSPSKYAMEFMRGFKEYDFDAMSETVENWLSVYPEDANAHYAHGVFIGTLVKTRNFDKDEGIKEMDIIFENTEKFESEGHVPKEFFKQLFSNIYDNITGE